MLLPGIAIGAFDPCSKARVLCKIRPGAAWTLHGDTTKDLTWLDKKQSKPTAAEIEKATRQCITDNALRDSRKTQARLEVKDPNTPLEKKVNDLILLLDMDR
jgi:hypothetical protein